MDGELNFATLDRIYEQVVKDGKKKMISLMIMDYVTASLKNLDVRMHLKKNIFFRRRYRLSIICLVQSSNAMPLATCKTINYLACYKPMNKENVCYVGRIRVSRQIEGGGPPVLRVRQALFDPLCMCGYKGILQKL